MRCPQIQRAQVPAFVERYRHHFLKRDEYLMPFDGIDGAARANSPPAACSSPWRPASRVPG